MLISILTWIFIFFGILLLMLLILPFRISLIGQADDKNGLSLEMKMDYAFGLIQVIAHNKESADIFILGCRIRRFSIETLKKESKRKGLSGLALFRETRGHFQQIVVILKRFVSALFLRGHIEGWIGLSDPADTARIDYLCRIMRISKDRFTFIINCTYDHEVMKINTRVRATVIIGYLGLVALGLILEKETRTLIRGLAQT